MTTDIEWLREAFRAAATISGDADTQNGAVIVPTDGVAVFAANRLPAGLTSAPWRLRRPQKYQWIEHAERAAIYQAAKAGVRTAGATMYCCWFACPECARAIIAAGIKEVVGHVTPRRLTPERWEPQVRAGERMLAEASISVRWLADPVGFRLRFSGEVIEC